MEGKDMKMRKLFSLVLIGGCICGGMITGCGGKSDSDKKDVKPAETEVVKETEEKKKDIKWPKSKLVDLLPVPEAEIGDVISNSSEYFSVEINDIDDNGFNDYVDKCLEKGFNVDYTKIDGSFNGSNESGYFLSLIYTEDDGQMLISLNAPQEATPEPTEEVTEAPTEVPTEPTEAPQETEAVAEPEPVASDVIRPEIKEAIDSYEAFFDEYCEFMKKYEESDSNLSLMADYASYMTKYADMLQKFQAMENEDLTDAELAYYLEVSGRIMEKTAQL